MFIERSRADSKKRGNRRHLIHGVGVNDAPYIPEYRDSLGKHHICPYYQKWRGVLRRVYCPILKRKYPTYVECTLEPAWLSFMAFRAWMETQDWQGKDLDKDLCDQGNKHYGPDTCLFVSVALNRLLCLNGKVRGAYPLGVSLASKSTRPRFQANCNFYGKLTHLGIFDTPEEAAAVYKTAKLAYIAELASQQTDPRIKQALLRLF